MVSEIVTRPYKEVTIYSIINCHDGAKVLKLEPYKEGAKVVFEGSHQEEAHDYIEQHVIDQLIVPAEAMSAELWERRNDRLYGRD